MEGSEFLLDAHRHVAALMFTQARTLGLLVMLPFFNQQLIPGMVRMAMAATIGLLVTPALVPGMEHLTEMTVVVVVVKEALVGFALGWLLCIPFWAMEAVGFIIDNQRGASIAATLNPLTGNDSSPLGILFNQAFIVFFMSAGGFLLILGVLYESFRLWPVFEWFPTLRPDTMPLLLAQLDRLVRLTMLLGSPVIVAMFLSELGLALISLFVPQLQVFFLAMPIKSALAVLVLLVYAGTLFDLSRGTIDEMRGVLPFLNEQFTAAPKAPR